jgi:hypothetical protein
MRRLPLVGLPSLLLAGVIFFITFGVPALLTNQPHPTYAQPVDFNHQIHVQEAGTDCMFCHRSAVAGPSAGMPELEQCMMCHQAVGANQPEIEKVRQAWATQQPINWVRVHRMPDHVRFTHEAHVKAGISCAACHGDVAKMSQVTQVRPLHMADCIECHKQMQAPTDCATCHF